MTEAKRAPYWLAYVLPYVIFLLITVFAEDFPGGAVVAYPLRVAATLAAVLWFWRAGAYPELDLRPSVPGILAGLVGFAFWVYPEDLLGFLPKLGESSFDPDASGEAWRAPLLAVRIAGAVLLVPVFEELFLRSFLLRWVDDMPDREEDFRAIPVGRYRLFSFVVVVAAMALTHHRWLRAGLYSAMLCLLLYREKRMGPVIWAHAVTNLCLGVYVVHHEAWWFW